MRGVWSRLGVSSDERGPLLLLLLQSLLLGVSTIAFYAPANARFLTRWTSAELPWTYVVAALIVVACGLSFSWASRLVSLVVLVSVTFVLLAAVTGAYWVVGVVADAPWLAFFGLVWFRVLWTVGNLGLWLQANQLFNIQQSKRIFPLIVLGSVAGLLLVASVQSPLIAAVGPLHEMGIAALALCAHLAVLAVTVWRFGGRLNSEQRPASSGATSYDPSERRFMLMIAVYTAFSTLGSYVLDYAFMTATRQRYSDPAELATFFGHYMGGLTVLVLLFTVLVSKRLFTAFGARGGLVANPALVLVGTVLAVVATLAGLPVALLFVLVVVAKVGDDLSVPTLTGPSVRMILQTLSPVRRVGALAIIETIVGPATMGLAGVLLLIAGQVGGAGLGAALWVELVVLVCWSVAAWMVGVRYRAMVRRSLHSVVRPDPGYWDDPTVRSALEAGLSEDDEDVVLLCARQLLRQRRTLPPAAVRRLLDHHSDVVRAWAVPFANLSAIRRRLRVEPLADVRAAMLQHVGTTSPAGASELLDHAMDGPDALAAVHASFSLAERAVHERADRLIEAWCLSDPARASSALSRHPEPPRSLVVPLLTSSDVSVSGPAMIAAARADHPMSQALCRPELRAYGRRALAVARRPMLAIQGAIELGLSVDDAARLLARTPAAVPSLCRWADSGSVERRSGILAVLQQLPSAGNVDAPLKHERDLAGRLRRLAGYSSGHDDYVADAINEARMACLVRAVGWLVLPLGAAEMNSAAQICVGRRRGDRAVALEALQTWLPRRERAWVLALLDRAPGQPLTSPWPTMLHRPEQLPLWLRACLTQWRVAAEQSVEPTILHGLERSLMFQRVLALKRCAMFRVLHDDVLVGLARIATERSADDGTVLIREGDQGGEAWLIVEGQVRVVRQGSHVATLVAGVTFGELEAFCDGERSADVIADGPVQLLCFSTSALRDLTQDHPELATAFLAEFAKRLRG